MPHVDSNHAPVDIHNPRTVDYLQHFPPVVLPCNDSEVWEDTFADFILYNGMTACNLSHNQCPSSIAWHDQTGWIDWMLCSPHKINHYFHSISWVLYERPFASPHLCLTGCCSVPCYNVSEGPDTLLEKLLTLISQISLRLLSIENHHVPLWSPQTVCLIKYVQVGEKT